MKLGEKKRKTKQKQKGRKAGRFVPTTLAHS